MLFYEFFRSSIGSRVSVMLKAGVYVSGRLGGIDPYLNLSLLDVRILSSHPGLSSISVCSIRGSSIKYILVDKDAKLLQGVNAGSRLRMILDKCY
ncbi:U6 snRNA-ASSOCIATED RIBONUCLEOPROTEIN [Encephalitozoon cuniculi GB-M1]|uniref:Probable U6 snRNA-associated Sm-like protein LSm2 n=2 Tax=Encephalitozoon cuniculi TaxID=6035 RepID=LSM2_ENCCU|nr:Sm-like protein [Encephalitozoon cuniculi GB-M1]Q8SQK1.1 RecName: Full=Probable U6 snRNA-associated Sm-like protein LSm2 [Encephalitozoon cuniculi GB-M1]AGE96345.1 U6 snRNA-associated ribonucleoprotein [Encephalitozoon cuniculi]KMV65362.1 small nuclear ribonucleoprotein [Encephalitozoon cuniculi EcunIII-L]UYI26878.1 U6 snRNA-associated Sm-like protein LSm2 [Encephalitozoon cuniculi]CAD27153.1 U6 snRNA-ASSOCIATED RIBONUCLEOPROTEIN [Encephalitozoon cuniculi GB-M1]